MKGLRALFYLGNFHCINYAYACSKHFITNTCINGNAENILNIIKRLFVTLIILLLNFLALIVFATYYEIINLILHLKHKENFFTILDGSDVIWMAEGKSRSLINALYMLESQENDCCEDLYKHFIKAYGELSETHPKLSCVRRRYMGYWYFLRKDIDITKYVRYMDDYKDINELQVLLDKYSNSALPLEDTGLWEIYIGKTKIKWNGNPGYQYPILVKYHHSLGDGVSLIAMMSSNLLEGGLDIMKNNCEGYRKIIENYRKQNKKNFKDTITSFFTRDIFIKHFPLLADQEINSLHLENLSGEKHLCWILENSQNNYIDKVKSIKRRFAGCSFSDVVLAAFSASVSEYLKENDNLPPKSIRVALTYYITSSEFDKIIKINNGKPVSKLKNNFSVGIVNAPIKTEKLEENLVEMLENVKQDSGILKESIDTHFLYWQLKIMSTLLPYPIIKESIRLNDKITVAATNVPGHKIGTLKSGHVITDTMIWPPNYFATGISFSIFTYNNKFRFGLLVDKAVIKNRKDVERIGYNLFKYIDLMEDAAKQLQSTRKKENN